ncbi:MAG TPA: four helix bundle protein [Thermoflexales bacterium]|nr:four helix bundle protein [Thermoflexales bacterium]HQZ98874.1 four helix bundle protein [Thermoflexales bacterium]
MSEKVKHYRDLRVWQAAIDLSVIIYKITESFPKHEQFGLMSQMRRASVSIGSNIAEGFNRSSKEFGRFVEMAMGSLAELETQCEIAKRIDYLKQTDYENLKTQMDVLGRQLNVLHQRLKGQQTTSNQQLATSN